MDETAARETGVKADTFASSGVPRKPNIVWVMADDLGSPLSFTGTAGVKTPHIDRLAREGMFFSRYYSTAPTCAPSRTTMLTGMYATYLNAQHHHSTPDFPPTVRRLAERLREDGGYYTANVAKVPQGYPFVSFGKRDYDWSRQHDPSLYDTGDYAGLKDHQPFYAEFQCIEPHSPWHSLEKSARRDWPWTRPRWSCRPITRTRPRPGRPGRSTCHRVRSSTPRSASCGTCWRRTGCWRTRSSWC